MFPTNSPSFVTPYRSVVHMLRLKIRTHAPYAPITFRVSSSSSDAKKLGRTRDDDFKENAVDVAKRHKPTKLTRLKPGSERFEGISDIFAGPDRQVDGWVLKIKMNRSGEGLASLWL